MKQETETFVKLVYLFLNLNLNSMSTCQILNRQVDDIQGHQQDMKIRYLANSCEDIAPSDKSTQLSDKST